MNAKPWPVAAEPARRRSFLVGQTGTRSRASAPARPAGHQSDLVDEIILSVTKTRFNARR